VRHKARVDKLEKSQRGGDGHSKNCSLALECKGGCRVSADTGGERRPAERQRVPSGV
jgi:hypothetical protein